jgi:hypothetical protein
MAQYKSEYTNSAVGCSGCAYNTSCSSGSRTMTQLRPGTTSGVFITPDYGGIGYDALTHGVTGGCQKYFNIQDAYGSGAGNCKTSYTSRTCGGCNGDGAVGKGMDWVCTTPLLGGQRKCVGVQRGTHPYPPGDVYHTSKQCQDNCKPGQRH